MRVEENKAAPSPYLLSPAFLYTFALGLGEATEAGTLLPLSQL